LQTERARTGFDVCARFFFETQQVTVTAARAREHGWTDVIDVEFGVADWSSYGDRRERDG